jgi:hypothetical protein
MIKEYEDAHVYGMSSLAFCFSGKKIAAPLGAARRELSPQGLSPDGSRYRQDDVMTLQS